MSNNLIIESNTSLRSAVWHAGIEVVTAPIFTQFIFFLSSDTLEEQYPDFSSISSRSRQIYEDLDFSDDFFYTSFSFPVP